MPIKPPPDPIPSPKIVNEIRSLVFVVFILTLIFTNTKWGENKYYSIRDIYSLYYIRILAKGI